jgi:hypothetical protein
VIVAKCSAPVVREHLHVVLGAPEGLDPLRHLPVLLPPLETRDLAIGDVADEQVTERELSLARNRRAASALDELLALEPVQDFLLAAHSAEPEDLSDHRRDVDERFLLRRERVEPRGDDPLQALGDGIALAALVEHPRVLLRVERQGNFVRLVRSRTWNRSESISGFRRKATARRMRSLSRSLSTKQPAVTGRRGTRSRSRSRPRPSLRPVSRAHWPPTTVSWAS